MNVILEHLGIRRRLPNEMNFGSTPHGNKPMNQYMTYQVTRLYKLLEVGNSEEFWNRAIHLMQNSIAFRTSAINRSFPRWYKTKPLAFILHVNKDVDSILEK
jgi:hypothetical protein